MRSRGPPCGAARPLTGAGGRAVPLNGSVGRRSHQVGETSFGGGASPAGSPLAGMSVTWVVP